MAKGTEYWKGSAEDWHRCAIERANMIMRLQEEVRVAEAKAEDWQRKYGNLRDAVRWLFGIEEVGGER